MPVVARMSQAVTIDAPEVSSAFSRRLKTQKYFRIVGG